MAPEQGDRSRSRAPLPRLLGVGARGVRAVAEATGLDEAAERSSEDALVAALESPAFERALERVLESSVAEDALDRALASPAVAQAVIKVLDSALVDRAWEHLLASEEAQQLVERIAQAPEVRVALASQGVGLLSDIGRGVREFADHFDEAIDSILTRFRGRRAPAPGPQRVGLITRAVAAAVDAGVLNLAFLSISAIFGVTIGGVLGDDQSPSGAAIAAGSALWIGAGATYLGFFWALAGQTIGMRLLSIRLDAGGERKIGARLATRRLLGTALSVLSFGLGFLLIPLDARRRSLADRFAGTEVLEDISKLSAPHSGRYGASSLD